LEEITNSKKTEPVSAAAGRVIGALRAAAVSGDLTVVVRMSCHLKKSETAEN